MGIALPQPFLGPQVCAGSTLPPPCPPHLSLNPNPAPRRQVSADSFDVLVTTYECVAAEVSALRKLRWCFLVVDEAHRLKNEQSKLSLTLRAMRVSHRLLLTGTPIQVQSTISHYITLYHTIVLHTLPSRCKVLNHATHPQCYRGVVAGTGCGVWVCVWEGWGVRVRVVPRPGAQAAPVRMTPRTRGLQLCFGGSPSV